MVDLITGLFYLILEILHNQSLIFSTPLKNFYPTFKINLLISNLNFHLYIFHFNIISQTLIFFTWDTKTTFYKCDKILCLEPNPIFQTIFFFIFTFSYKFWNKNHLFFVCNLLMIISLQNIRKFICITFIFMCMGNYVLSW